MINFFNAETQRTQRVIKTDESRIQVVKRNYRC